MAITLTPKNSRFTKNLYWMGLPHTNLLTDAFLFGKDQASSTKNLAPYGKGNGNGIANGTATYTDKSANVGMTENIQSSNAILTNNFTILAVVKINSSGIRFAFGTYDGSSKGVLVYGGTDGQLHAGGEVINGNDIALPIKMDAEKYTVVGIKYDGNQFTLLTFENDLMSSKSANSTANVTALPLRFGMAIGFTYSNFDIAFGAGYNTALTDEQLKDTYEHLKKLMTNRGINLV